MKGKILLARPRIYEGEAFDKRRPGYRIFADWRQLNRAAAFTDRVLFVAKSCVSHPEDTKRFRIVRLIRDQLGGFGSCLSKGSMGRRCVAPHSSRYTLAPAPRKWDGVIITSSNRQCGQGATGAVEIALAKRYFKPKLRYVLGFARIFGNDRTDGGAQRMRISMPLELDRSTIRSHA